MRVLLVEDHEDTLIGLSRLLTNCGYNVDAAHDVHSARELCERNRYDVLLADIALPDGNGWDLMRELLSRCSLPGIALTGYGYASDIRKSLEAGFVEHLTKPVDVDQLLEAIRKAAQLKEPKPE